MIYLIGLWANVLPGLLLLLLVGHLAERLQPGYGAATAVILGLGTLTLPLSTLLFSHVFTAFLGFAAFALMWHERDGPPNPWYLGWPDCSLGYAGASEYPLFFVALVLGLYLLSRRDSLTPLGVLQARGRLRPRRADRDRAAAALQPLRVSLLDAPGLLRTSRASSRASSGSGCRA